MRLLTSALLLPLAVGCQVLPKTELDCTASGRCEPFKSVYGQPDVFTDLGARRGMHDPMHALINGEQLLIADSSNGRVLIWDTFPTANQQAPDRVLGQADLSYNTDGFEVSARTLTAPRTLAISAGRLLVGDRNNNRILIWDRAPAKNTPSFFPRV